VTARPVAIVTGGGSGMGAATARRLARDGARVVVVDTNGDAATAVAKSLDRVGIAVAADVSSEGAVDDYTQAALREFGRIDWVVLNAGIASATPLIEESVEVFDRIVAVNLRGVFLGLRAALRQMRDQSDGGAVVVTASTAGLSGTDLAAYGAAKHGVVSLVRTAAIEGAPLGVRVNAIAPGSIDTPLMSGLERRLGGGADARRMLHAMTPLGRQDDRFGTPEEVAALIAFLISDDASWITGAVVPIDGGVLSMDPYRVPSREA